MATWSIAVFARLCPPRAGKKVLRVTVDEPSHSDAVATLRIDTRSPSAARSSSGSALSFRFTKVFDTRVSQAAVYKTVAKPVVLSSLDGYNGTIFAYGQTGTGKTFTITGGERYRERGIIPRAITTLFREFGKRQQTTSFVARVSYLEIYNESVYDLLDRHGRDPIEKWPKVTVRNGRGGDIYLQNLKQHIVETEEDALNLLFAGNASRVTAETESNLASSRSHCVFTVTLEARDTTSDVVRVSKLNLVDLAGSERITAFGTGSDRSRDQRKEGKHINLSLHYLQQVIAALQERTTAGRKAHIPYRNSMLTSVLRDSLGGNCRTAFVSTMSTEADSGEESLSTCRFAMRCSRVKQTVHVNEQRDMKLMVSRLTAEKEQYAMELRQLLQQGGASSHDENRKLAEAERNACESMVAQFITNEHKELEFQDAAVARECCAILKDSIRRAVYAAADASTAADMLRTRLEENRIVLRQQQQTIAQYLSQPRMAGAAAVPEQGGGSSSGGAGQASTSSAPNDVDAQNSAHHGVRAPLRPAVSPSQAGPTHRDLRRMLRCGGVFLKHRRSGTVLPRVVWVNAEGTYICWRDVSQRRVRGRLRVSDVVEVVPGAAADVSKQLRNAARTDAFITLRTADGALSLEVEVLGVPPEDTVAPSEVEVRDAWLAAFRFLLSSHPFPPGDDLIRTPAVSERMSTDSLLAALTPDGLAAGSGGATGAAGAGAGAGSRGGVFNDESV